MLHMRDSADQHTLEAHDHSGLRLRLQRFDSNANQHQGGVLIVASGPSAADFPLAHYRHVPMIAMNGSLLRLQQDHIAPLFYLCDDPRFAKARHPVITDAIATAQHVALNLPALSQYLHDVPNAVWQATPWLLERVNRSWRTPRRSDRCFAWRVRHDAELLSAFSLLRNKPNRLGFSTNMAKGYYSARTIPYCALQLAYHLGFSHAFLVGLDLNPSQGRCYPEGDRPLKSTLDIDYDDFILPSFTFMQTALPQAARPFQVYNLSTHSRLPASVVPKLTVTELDAMLATLAPSTAQASPA